MMKRMSFSETIFLFFLALIVFGPKKLPEIARQIGKVLNEFRRASNEFKSQIEQEISNIEVENRKQTALPASPAPEGTASRTLNTASNESSNGAAGAESPTPSNETPAQDTPARETPAQETTGNSADAGPTEPAATLAASTEAATTPANHSEPEPAPEPVTSTASQESHV
jgi:sec-independent protein translocase protein TatB